MTYPVSEISNAQALYLKSIDEDAFEHVDTKQYYTYQDIAAAHFAVGTYVDTTITEAVNEGTLPINLGKPKKPMFPR